MIKITSGFPQGTQPQVTKLLEDFDEFERTMLAPYEMYPTNAQNFVGDNQDNYMIIQSGSYDEGQFTIEATGDCSENVNVTSCTSHGSITVEGVGWRIHF